jgi:hypothetical protein
MKAPEWLWGKNTLSINERAVYANLLKRRNKAKGGLAWPSQELIAAELGISPATVKRALRRLKTAGLIDTVRQPAARVDRRFNVYVVHTPDDAPIGISVIPVPAEVGITDARDRDQNRAKYGSQRPHNRLKGTPSKNQGRTDVPAPWGATEPPMDDDDWEALPLEALADVLAWHESEDDRTYVIEPTTIQPGHCSRCDSLLTPDEQRGHGMCTGCLDRVPEHDDQDTDWWPWWDELATEVSA